MSAPAASSIIRAPGRLAYGATDLSTAWPHGGTGLGGTRGVEMVGLHELPSVVRAREWGGAPVEFYRRGEFWRIACFLRGWDDDAVSVLFPNTAAGTISQRTRISSAVGSGTQPGRKESDRGIQLVFTPDDQRNVPGWVMFRAVPNLEVQQSIMYQRGEEFGVPVVFDGLPDGNKRVLEWGRLADLEEFVP